MSRVIWVRVGDIHLDMKGEEHHFLALGGEVIFGVVRLLEHGPAGGQWLWSMTQVHPGPPLDVPRSDTSANPQRGGNGMGSRRTNPSQCARRWSSLNMPLFDPEEFEHRSPVLKTGQLLVTGGHHFAG